MLCKLSENYDWLLTDFANLIFWKQDYKATKDRGDKKDWGDKKLLTEITEMPEQLPERMRQKMVGKTKIRWPPWVMQFLCSCLKKLDFEWE